MYDIDLFNNDAATVASLHKAGRKVVCSMDAGRWESGRPDSNQFPSSVLGRSVAGFPNEKWLDIRQLADLQPIMSSRMDLCKEKGFDSLAPDNVDGFQNPTGFPLTYADQIAYNIWIATASHSRGLSVALKNDRDQIGDLLPYFDWALDEQCFQYSTCDTLVPFVSAGKAVFDVEYSLSPSQFCPQSSAMKFNSMKKNRNLDAAQSPCSPPDGLPAVITPPSSSGVRVYPNPWRSESQASAGVTFEGLSAGGEVKIFSVAGQWVATLAPADSTGKAIWDLNTNSGDRAASGLYIYLINDARKTHGKLSLIR